MIGQIRISTGWVLIRVQLFFRILQKSSPPEFELDVHNVSSIRKLGSHFSQLLHMACCLAYSCCANYVQMLNCMFIYEMFCLLRLIIHKQVTICYKYGMKGIGSDQRIVCKGACLLDTSAHERELQRNFRPKLFLDHSSALLRRSSFLLCAHSTMATIPSWNGELKAIENKHVRPQHALRKLSSCKRLRVSKIFDKDEHCGSSYWQALRAQARHVLVVIVCLRGEAWHIECTDKSDLKSASAQKMPLYVDSNCWYIMTNEWNGSIHSCLAK